MARGLRVLGIHGLGDHRNSPWASEWEATLREALPTHQDASLDFIPFSYDQIFEQINVSPIEALRAFWKLAGSGLGLPREMAELPGLRDRAVSASHFLRWYAGYVVAWLEDDDFRTEVRRQLLETIADKKPDIVLAHSLGSLISYDAFSSEDDLSDHPAAQTHLKKLTYVTLGSQLANPFVVGNLTPGRIEMLDVRYWYHLFNEHDSVFTAPIRLPGEDRFLQIRTSFDIDGFADHEATEYLRHPAAVEQLWTPLWLHYSTAPESRAIAARMVEAMRPVSTERAPRRRALLVGINEYPNPSNRLAGCVNDAFRMSAVMQERGFDADDIRVVLNDRATTKGILDRVEWLLDDARANDQLVFYYSGHGAQLPTYGEGDAVDKMDETLVPFDFNWSPETCITDDQIYHLYVQLPYATRLTMIFDCCHAGGIHRDGGLRVRGLDPPDDIRHRMLQWDAKTGLWKPREMKKLNEEFVSPRRKDAAEVSTQYTGRSGTVMRLGRAMRLRQQDHQQYDRERRGLARGKQEATGPYLPVILEACREDQYAYEYRHGVESFGAFTFSLTEILRQDRKATFTDLRDQTLDRLTHVLKFDQEPQLLGPGVILGLPISW
jgi:metacaspase-1